MSPVPTRLGILGGGQLGRMLATAAARLGVDVHIYTPENNSPAARVAAATTRAAWDDDAALSAFAAGVDVITFEFENIPIATLETLSRYGAKLAPGARSLAFTQDRLVEKTFVRELGLQTVPFEPVACLDDLAPAMERLAGPGILKRRRFGYDGRGQARISGPEGATDAWQAIGAEPGEQVECIVEGLAGFDLEISALVARSASGALASWDVPHNLHVGGILDRSFVPAPVGAGIEEQARDIACKVAHALDHVGVLAVELFVMADGRLVVNEIAPRVHNSGHWTPEACATGQFEQHVRAVLGLPLGPTTRRFNAEMHNLVGADLPLLADLLSSSASDTGEPSAGIVTLYGKTGARAGRKMGHVVTLRPYDA